MAVPHSGHTPLALPVKLYPQRRHRFSCIRSRLVRCLRIERIDRPVKRMPPPPKTAALSQSNGRLVPAIRSNCKATRTDSTPIATNPTPISRTAGIAILSAIFAAHDPNAESHRGDGMGAFMAPLSRETVDAMLNKRRRMRDIVMRQTRRSRLRFRVLRDGSASSRKEARRRVGQRLPVCPPFGASWQMAARPCDTVPRSSLKFRTAGFPRYGFKPDTIRRHLRRLRRLIGGRLHRVPPGLAVSRTVSGRGAVHPVRSDPEALGSASGYAVPSRRRLLWPHPSFWQAPGGLYASPAGLCLAAAGQKVPAFICESFPSCHLPYPDGPGG